MTHKPARHPVKHFLIMTRVQQRFIFRGVIAVSLLSLFSLLMVVILYYLKYRTGYFYYMTESLEQDLIRYSIWDLILPSAGPALFASILIGVGMALWASRKIALPLFKIRQWAVSMFAGDLNYKVTLRESDDLYELETSCHQVSQKYNEIFRTIKNTLHSPDKNPEEKLAELEKYLDEFNLNEKET